MIDSGVSFSSATRAALLGGYNIAPTERAEHDSAAWPVNAAVQAICQQAYRFDELKSKLEPAVHGVKKVRLWCRLPTGASLFAITHHRRWQRERCDHFLLQRKKFRHLSSENNWSYGLGSISASPTISLIRSPKASCIIFSAVRPSGATACMFAPAANNADTAATFPRCAMTINGVK